MPVNLWETDWLAGYKKQSFVECSIAEFEYVSTGRCCAQILWIQNKLLDYVFKFLKTHICCDNTIAILITQNPIQHSKTEHIEIWPHFIRDNVQKGKIERMYIPIDDQLADSFHQAIGRAEDYFSHWWTRHVFHVLTFFNLFNVMNRFFNISSVLMYF